MTHDHSTGPDTKTSRESRASLVSRALAAVRRIFNVTRRPPPAGPSVYRRRSSRSVVTVQPPARRPAPPSEPPQDETQTDIQPPEPNPAALKRLPNPHMVYKGRRRSGRPHRTDKDTGSDDDDYQPAE